MLLRQAAMFFVVAICSWLDSATSYTASIQGLSSSEERVMVQTNEQLTPLSMQFGNSHVALPLKVCSFNR